MERAYRTSKRRAVGWLILCAFLLSGCEQIMQDMYDQPRHEPLEKSRFFLDGQSSRPLVEHTVIHAAGGFAGPSSGRESLVKHHGTVGEVNLAQGDIPIPITLKLLQRGQERYNIYCSPCHGIAGYGHGLVVLHGFPAPPSYHIPRLRHAPDAHFYNVITTGFARMFSYASRVKPRDRWAITAYIRALQLSQHASLDRVLDMVKERPFQLQEEK